MPVRLTSLLPWLIDYYYIIIAIFIVSVFFQDMFLKQLSTFVEGEREDEELPLECHQYAPPQVQDQIFHREQVEGAYRLRAI